MSLAYAFEDLGDPAQDGLADALMRHGVRMAFAKDEEIYAQEDGTEFVYAVVRGGVRTIRLMSDGRRQIGEFYYAGEVFGLEPGPERRYAAEALCECEVLVLKRSALRRLADDESLERAVWQATRRELERTQGHLMLLGRKTACERVASFLADMVERRGSGAVDLPMSRQDIADYLGLTIETVSRMLTQLQTSRIVEFAGCRHFQVRNHDALSRLAA
ncbi:helix-turn-helix domain-containing protein [Phenylobacterium terrae]|uniref:Helix-turn-helix domain-containing protein n=1 Tax=Phenylobacterium terrae TaxID=2665495 RepID=A0ABW4MWB2_9CAUL